MIAANYPRSFFERPPDVVARDLIGSLLVVQAGKRTIAALIVETEAYGGSDDPASHAFRGSTPRCEVMFGPAGFLYVYRSYGIHWCMNVVTGEKGTASAVLLRAAEQCAVADDAGLVAADSGPLSGPGNLTRGLGIDGADNGTDCCQPRRSRVAFHKPADEVGLNQIHRTERIGVSKGKDRLSRYFLEGHSAVSGTRRQRSE